jgi:hypothetical protein
MTQTVGVAACRGSDQRRDEGLAGRVQPGEAENLVAIVEDVGEHEAVAGAVAEALLDHRFSTDKAVARTANPAYMKARMALLFMIWQLQGQRTSHHAIESPRGNIRNQI